MKLLIFVAYVGGCGLVLYAQLILTIRECKQLMQRRETSIDQFYVRIERYLGLSFRSKLADWLAAASADLGAGTEQRLLRGHEQIVIVPTARIASDSHVDDILVTGDFACAPRCHLSRELYVRGDCDIGESSIVQAVAADGSVILRRDTRVIRWLDAVGRVFIEPSCEVRGRLTSTTSIALGPGSRVKSAYAPVVGTARNGSTTRTPPVPNGRMALSSTMLDYWIAAGANRRRLRLLAPDCLEYDGDLTLGRAVVLTKLVVRGTLTVAPGSELRQDVKATRSLRIGANSVCLGNLVAGRDVQLGPMVVFAGVVYAERHVRIGEGVLGRASNRDVAVYGCETVTLGHDVWLHGKVAAGHFVVAST